MIEIIGDLLIIGCGAAFSWAFLIMIFTGNYLVFESNPFILLTEAILSLVTVGIGIGRFINDARKGG